MEFPRFHRITLKIRNRRVRSSGALLQADTSGKAPYTKSHDAHIHLIDNASRLS